MKKQLEMKALIIWAMFMCVLWIGVANANETMSKKMSDEQLKCIIMGGQWVDNTCVKSAKIDNTVPKCDPFVCLITWNGKCINGECVKQYPDTNMVLTPQNTSKPKH